MQEVKESIKEAWVNDGIDEVCMAVGARPSEAVILTAWTRAMLTYIYNKDAKMDRLINEHIAEYLKE